MPSLNCVESRIPMYRLADKLKLFAGCVLVLTAITSPLFATGIGPPVPEIDPGLIGSAAALLVGGYLVVVSRTRRK